jgi:hypothetical protein
MDVAINILIAAAVILVLGSIIRWSRRKDEPSGTINVFKDGSRIIYSLELDDDPEDLQYKDKIIFRVKNESVEDSTQNKHGV